MKRFVIILTVVALAAATASPAFARRGSSRGGRSSRRTATTTKTVHNDQNLQVVGPVTAVTGGLGTFITVEGTGSDKGRHVFTVSKTTTVTINGAVAKPDAIKVGDQVTVGYVVHHYDINKTQSGRYASYSSKQGHTHPQHSDTQTFSAHTITVTR